MNLAFFCLMKPCYGVKFTISQHSMCEGRWFKSRWVEGKYHRRKALLGGSGGMLPRENLEILVQFGGIWCGFFCIFRVDRTVKSRVFQSIF